MISRVSPEHSSKKRCDCAGTSGHSLRKVFTRLWTSLSKARAEARSICVDALTAPNSILGFFLHIQPQRQVNWTLHYWYYTGRRKSQSDSFSVVYRPTVGLADQSACRKPKSQSEFSSHLAATNRTAELLRPSFLFCWLSDEDLYRSRSMAANSVVGDRDGRIVVFMDDNGKRYRPKANFTIRLIQEVDASERSGYTCLLRLFK